MLVTYTTHMKAGFVRRNGAPSSDRATMRQFIVRHGDLLTITSMLEDPVYLTEPYVVSRSFQLDPRANIRTTQGACEPISEVPELDETGVVPRHLPGRNPFINELPQIYNIPVEAVLGRGHDVSRVSQDAEERVCASGEVRSLLLPERAGFTHDHGRDRPAAALTASC